MRNALQRWQPTVSGLALGLYASRVIAESRDVGWSLLSLFLLLIACNAVGLCVAIWGRRYLPRHTALIVLLGYVLYPRVSPELAWSVGWVTLLALVISHVPRRWAVPGWMLDLGVWALSLAFYTYTLAPTILPADSGEFQLVAYRLGIAHPPGYPLYTLLGKLFTLLPMGDYARRVNWLSAVAAALTLALLNRLLRQTSGSVWAGFIAVLALGAAPTFWAQATTANIRGLTALFTVLPLYLLHRYSQATGDGAGERVRRRSLIGFAVAFGLGITHHGSLGFLALPCAIYLLMADSSLPRRWRDWIGAAVAFLLSLSVLLYLPLRSRMNIAQVPESMRGVSSFWEHVLAQGFRGDMFAFARPDLLAARLPILANILFFQFGLPLLLVAVVGVIWLLARQRKQLLLFGGVALVNGFVAITYRAPQTVEYLMPAYVGLTALLGWGAATLLRSSHKVWRGIVAAALLGMGAANLANHYPSFAALREDRSARQEAETLLQAAPQGALILSNWHQVTPLWYLQYAEGWRPDVEIVYVYPEGATPMAEVWQRRIKEAYPSRPVIVTNHFPAFETLPYRFLPFQGAEQVIAGALFDVPAGMIRLDVAFEDKIRLCGYALTADEALRSGDELVLRLCWQPLQPLERDYSFFVHLVDPAGGLPLGQADKTHPAGRYQIGEVIVDEYRLLLLPTTTAGRYALLAGVYITLPDGGWQRLKTDEGRDTIPLTEVTVRSPDAPPVTTHPLRWIFAGGLRCLGVDYDTSLPDVLRAYLHWQRPPGVQGTYDALLHRDGTLIARQRIPQVEGYMTMALDAAPDKGSLRLEVRLAEGDVRLAPLGPWHCSWQRSVPLPGPRPGERHVVLGGEMTLERAVWEPDEAWKWESTGRVVLQFQATRPLLRDYSVSVGLYGADGSFVAQHDGTPALGAIPTLKWLRGTWVSDLHLVQIPASAPSGEALLRLAVYDAFTLRPLPLLDDRFARLGQGTQMTLGRVLIQP